MDITPRLTPVIEPLAPPRQEAVPPSTDVPDTTDALKAQRREEFLALARKRWQVVEQAESTLRGEMLADLQFLQPGGQWDAVTKASRLRTGDPCLEIDRLTGAIKQICNSQRQMRPSVQVAPVDSGSDPDTAEVFQGMVRHIEIQSDADVAYDTAGQHQVEMGRGYLRVVMEYEDERTNNKRLRIRRVPNPFSIYMDPTGTMADGSDSRFGFIVTDVPKDEYADRFGDESLQYTLSEFTSVGNTAQADWMPEGRIRVAEYFYRDDLEMALVQLPAVTLPDGTLQDGATVRVPPDEIPEGAKELRRVEIKQVFVALINGAEILEGNEDKTAGREWPGQYIPIIPVIGDESRVNGVLDLQGIVRKAKDVERMGNAWTSYITGQIMRSNRVPWIVAHGQLEGHEKKWDLSNQVPFAFLEYNPVDAAGKPVPPPQRDRSEPPIQAATMALAQNANDFRAVTGYVDVQASEKKSESSGRAILARQHQSELGNSNYIDNLGRAIRHVGRVLVDIIPAVYDAPRVVRILGLDDKSKTVMVHAGQPPPEGQPGPDGKPQLPDGVEGIYDLSAGTYDVTLSVGPSHQSMRAEGVESMLSLMQALPMQAPLIAPAAVRNMDWPGAQEVSKILTKALPPQFQEQKPGENQIPPHIQQQIQQQGQAAQQLIDGLTAKVNELQQASDMKRLELESRERIARIQAETTMAVAESKATTTSQIALLESRMQQIEHLAELDIQRIQATNVPPPVPLGADGASAPGLPAPQTRPARPPAAPSPMPAAPAAPPPVAGPPALPPGAPNG